MSKIYTSADQLTGHTPLLELMHIEAEEGSKARTPARLEYFNPAGSVKDRIARGMFNGAEQRGALKKGSVIIEPASGNTGIGLTSAAAARGYRIIIVMPDSMSVERRSLMKACGAELVLTEDAKGMRGVMAKVEELAKEIPSSFIPGQFVNPANLATYEKVTGPEAWEDTGGEVDYLVSGVGMGGILTGMGRYLRSRKPGIRLTAVGPDASPVLSDGQPGLHKIQGFGAGFVPDTLDTKIYNEVIRVSNEDAFREGREIERAEDTPISISSGAAFYAAVQLTKWREAEDKTIVVLLSDSGDHYPSPPLPQD